MFRFTFQVESMVRMKREKAREEEMKDRKSSNNGVDYSWLSTQTPLANNTTPEMTVLEALQLHQICKRVHGRDCASVIARFRQQADSMNVKPQDVVGIMRQVVSETVASSSARSGSIRFRNRVSPQSPPDDVGASWWMCVSRTFDFPSIIVVFRQFKSFQITCTRHLWLNLES